MTPQYKDIHRILANASWVLRGGTLTDRHQNWTLVWPYGWWRVWLGDPGQLRTAEDAAKYVTTFSDKIFFSILSYGAQCPNIAKIVQNTEGTVELNTALILGNLSQLLRGKSLAVVVDGEVRTVRYDAVNGSLNMEVPAVVVRPDAPPLATYHSCGMPNMSFQELVTILSSGGSRG